MNLHRASALVVVLGSALAIASLSRVASGNAANRTGPPGAVHLPPGLVAQCPAPTLAVCQDEMVKGGVCASTNADACGTIMRDAFAASWTADQGSTAPPICHESNNGWTCDPVGGPGLHTAIMPPTMTRGGVFVDASLKPFDFGSLVSSGSVSSDMSYASILQTADLPAPGTSVLETIQRIPRTPVAWTTDGTAVRHCAEYVYKKNWDYVRFEEAALSCHSDWLCVYDAFSRSGASDFGLDKPTLYSRDALHNPTAIQVRPQSAHPPIQKQKKNGFFPEDVDPIIFGTALRNHTTAAEAAAIASALSVNYAFVYEYTDRVTWHIERHDAQWAETGGVGLTLPEYKEHERRLATYAELLAQYRALRDGDPTAINSALDPNLFDACGNALSVDPLTGDVLATGCKKKGPYKPKAGTVAAALASVVDSLAAFLVTEWHHKSFVDGVTVDHGCLATDSTRCDWSPKMVAAEYLGLDMSQREYDYKHCVVETAENFVSQYPTMEPTVGFRDARSDWDAFKDWMDRADVARGEITKDLPWVATDTIGSTSAGTQTIGDTSWFAASYDYEASWNVHMDKVVDPTSGDLAIKRICRSQGKATAKLVANAWALGHPFGVVDAYVNINAGKSGVGGAAGDPSAPVTAHLYLLGKEIYANDTTPTFDLAPDPQSFGAEHHETVFIGPVPVTLGAKIEFEAGFTAHAGGSAPQPADADCNFADPAGVQMEASVTPFGKANAAAYGAIGGEFAGLGAEAGVEGHITLIDAKLPTTATVNFGQRTAFDGSDKVPSVHVKVNTGLDLEFMSGGVVAYVEVCYVIDCKRTEKPIYTWPGINVHENVWTPLDKDYPIEALEIAAPPKPVASSP